MGQVWPAAPPQDPSEVTGEWVEFCLSTRIAAGTAFVKPTKKREIAARWISCMIVRESGLDYDSL